MISVLIPVFWLTVITITAFYTRFQLRTENGQAYCAEDSTREIYNRAGFGIWISTYFIIPTVVLISLNFAIYARLRQIRKYHKALAVQSHSNMSCQVTETCFEVTANNDKDGHKPKATSTKTTGIEPSLSKSEALLIKSGVR